MLLDTRNLWTAYLFIVQRKLSDMRLGSIQGRKEYGGWRKRKVFVTFVFLVLAGESVEENGDVRELEREWACGLISERIGE